MKILDLSLTYHWYDEIAAGNKPEEYRADTPFYKSRFMSGYNPRSPICVNPCKDCAFFQSKECHIIYYDAIRFHRGQASRTTMLVEWKGLSYDRGNPIWGAPDHSTWIIKLGNKIQMED